VSGRRAWLALGLLAALAAVLILAQSGTKQDSPEHSSLSDGPNGTSALNLYAGALGHPVDIITIGFNLPDPPATLFVFNPFSFTAAETGRLKDWVRSGGTLVYADDGLDPRLALAFGLHKGNPIPAQGRPLTPVLAGVNSVGDASYAEPYRPTPDQVVLIEAANGAALVIEEAVGQGRVVAVAAPELLCNDWLDQQDNGRLAADLVGMTPGPVAFDEFHHGLGAGGSADWTNQPLGRGLFGGALLVFLGLVIRGRAFGPRLAPAGRRGRSAAEYAVAVGHLLRQAGGRALALQVVSDATRRALAARLGLRSDVPLARLDEVMARRAPGLAADYRQVAAEAGAGAGSEKALLAAARRLHDLAYPMARR
jgi:Domain of unknown function (DUF4350)